MEQLAALTDRHALPAIFEYREFALAGGLMSFGTSLGLFLPTKLASMPHAFSKATSQRLPGNAQPAHGLVDGEISRGASSAMRAHKSSVRRPMGRRG